MVSTHGHGFTEQCNRGLDNLDLINLTVGRDELALRGVCACVCVSESERERERDMERLRVASPQTHPPLGLAAVVQHACVTNTTRGEKKPQE